MSEKWQDNILKICKKEKIEIYPSQAPLGMMGYIFYRPTPVNKTIQEEIKKNVPDNIPIAFKDKENPVTFPALIALFITSGARRPPKFKVEDHHITINAYDIDPNQVDRMRIDTILEKDNFFNSWTVNVNDQLLYESNLIGKKLSKEIQKNKNLREQILTDTDITDLKINLETCNNIDEFLERY